MWRTDENTTAFLSTSYNLGKQAGVGNNLWKYQRFLKLKELLQERLCYEAEAKQRWAGGSFMKVWRDIHLCWSIGGPWIQQRNPIVMSFRDHFGIWLIPWSGKSVRSTPKRKDGISVHTGPSSRPGATSDGTAHPS